MPPDCQGRRQQKRCGATFSATENHMFPMQNYDNSIPLPKLAALFFRSFHSFQQFSVFLLHILSTSFIHTFQRQERKNTSKNYLSNHQTIDTKGETTRRSGRKSPKVMPS